MSYQLRKLTTKKQVDSAIRDTEDKVLLLRFGKENDPVTMQLDNTVRRTKCPTEPERGISDHYLFFCVGVTRDYQGLIKQVCCVRRND